MSQDWRQSSCWIGWLALGTMIAAGLAGCMGDNDEQIPTPAATATATTAFASPTIEASPAATTAASPTRTVTPAATPTQTPIPPTPLGEVRVIDPFTDPNFTLDYSLTIEGVPNVPDFRSSLLIQQSAPDAWHLMATTPEGGFESWLTGGTVYLRQGDGSIARLPEGTDTALFSPALMLQTIPPISTDVAVTPAGSERINGIRAERYHATGEAWLASLDVIDPAMADDVRGSVDILVDPETRLLLRLDGGVTWTNPDRSFGSWHMRYELSQIGTTPAVTPPQ